MDYYILITRINLVFQIVILLLLSASFRLMKRGKFVEHGTAMLVAVILNVISFSLVMGPSLVSLGATIRDYPLNQLSIVSLTHASLGGVALILGIWIVASWHRQPPNQSCQRKRKFMRLTFVLWFVALLLGILLQMLLNGIITL